MNCDEEEVTGVSRIVRLENVIDPETGYVPLPFFESRCVPGILVMAHAMTMVPLAPHYKLVATLRDDHGEYLGFRIVDFRISNVSIQANYVGEGVEPFDEIKDSIVPSLKECIPLHGPYMQPGCGVFLAVRNLANRTGTLSAILYATPRKNHS
jgi:hypothetical protein